MADEKDLVKLGEAAVSPDRITIGEIGAQRNMHALGLSCGMKDCKPCEKKRTELEIDIVYNRLFGSVDPGDDP